MDHEKYSKLAECHPKVFFAIECQWGSRECRKYLTDLMIPTDIAPPVALDLTELMQVSDILDEHDAQFPNFKPMQAADRWAGR